MSFIVSFIQLAKACWYFALHPFDVVYLTVVRRYADAQKHFISELYEGEGRAANMIGASCDNFPLNADTRALPVKPSLCWGRDFTAPLPANTLRVGAFDPKENEAVRRYMAVRRFSIIRITILNRFVEHILEQDHV